MFPGLYVPTRNRAQLTGLSGILQLAKVAEARALGPLPVEALQGLLKFPGALWGEDIGKPGRAWPPGGFSLSEAPFPHLRQGMLDCAWEGGSWKDLVRQPSVPLCLWP